MPEDSIALSELARHVQYEAEIATLARRYYEEEGCVEGKALDHWLRAEKEIQQRMPPESTSNSQ
jgi:hypothetical protein